MKDMSEPSVFESSPMVSGSWPKSTVFFINTRFKPVPIHVPYDKKHYEWNIRLGLLENNTPRIKTIGEWVEKDLDRERSTLIISDRKKLAKRLFYDFGLKYQVDYVDGSTSKKKKAGIIQGVESGDIKGLFATSVAETMFAVGSDAPHSFDSLHLVTPMNSYRRLYRRYILVGRDKPGVIRDYVDNDSWFFNSFRRRKKAVREIGWIVREIGLDNNLGLFDINH
jgi:hypothetical protein